MGIKRKIIAGFLLLLGLIFVAVFSVYKLATQLTPPDQGVSSSVKKLTLTSNLLSSLIEVDGMARAYINTGDTVYLNQYRQQQQISGKLIDSLTLSSISNTNQFLRMLKVDSLMDLKKATYSSFFALRRNTGQYKSVDFSNIARRYDQPVRIPEVSERVPEEEETPAVAAETKKKGFFSRLWSNIGGKKSDPDTVAIVEPTVKVIQDTALSFKTVRDTTLSLVKSQLQKMAAVERFERQLQAEREMMLVQADQDIMNEIRAVLLLFEKEEIAKAISGTEKSSRILHNLWIIALILAATGLLTAIGFIIMIWKDLARSAFYRKQSEQARALAESLLKVKEQFLANISHEIRTPLTSIIGFTERLSETPVNKEQSKYLRYINSSSEHLLELINDLLDFSRIGSGKMELDSKTFDPADLFEQAYESLSTKARDKGLEIILSQNIPPVLLTGDPLRLRQVIINLLGNSIKFTEKGKVMLQTKATLSENGKVANIIIRIADTGIGIPEDKQQSIFEEFSQVDHSITRKYGGSGLGLTISHKLVELMNGTISVLSRPDQGTIFTIKLSLPVSNETILRKVQETDIKHPDLKKAKILLAEDDVTTNTLITEFLQSCNAVVYSVTNGADALKLFKADPQNFAIIITDIQMPGLSGPQLVQAVKEICNLNGYHQPVIIGLTAHADNSETKAFLESGMNYFILKPFKNQDIKMVLNSITSANKRTPAGKKSTEQQEPEASQDLIDFSNFREFTGDDEDSLNIILLSLVDNIRRTSGEMQSAFESADYNELALLAHRILPNIRLLGAKNTAALIREIEIKGRESNVKPSELGEKLSAALSSLAKLSKQITEKQPS